MFYLKRFLQGNLVLRNYLTPSVYYFGAEMKVKIICECSFPARA